MNANLKQSTQVERKPFSLRTFHALFDRMAINFPDMEITNWKDIIRNGFDLTPQQEMSLNLLTDENSQLMQQRFIAIEKHILNGGNIQGRITKQANGFHRATVHLHTQGELSGIAPTMITIVECDANCENWEWFPN